MSNAWDSDYQNKKGWAAFFTLLIVLMVLNMPFLIMSGSLQNQTVHESLSDINQYYEAIETRGDVCHCDGGSGWSSTEFACVKGLVTKDDQYCNFYGDYSTWVDVQHRTKELNVTDKENIQIINELNSQLEINMDEVFSFCIATAFVHLLFSFVVFVIVILKRNTIAVKRRGAHFLWHLSVSVVLAIVSLLILSAGQLCQIPGVDPRIIGLRNFAIFYAVMTACCFFFIMSVFSAMTCRARLVYLALSSTRFDRSKLSFSSYFQIIPLIILLFLVSAIPVCLALSGVIGGPWHMLSYYVPTLILGIWVSYYTLKIESKSNEFSDTFINMRCIWVCVISLMAFVTYDEVYSTLLHGGPGALFCIQASTLLYFLDQSSSLLYYSIIGKLEIQLGKHQTLHLSPSENRTIFQTSSSNSNCDINVQSNDMVGSNSISQPPGNLGQVIELKEIKKKTNEDVITNVIDIGVQDDRNIKTDQA